MSSIIECPYCGNEYKPESSRWMCDSCGAKSSCCEGEAQQPRDEPTEK